MTRPEAFGGPPRRRPVVLHLEVAVKHLGSRAYPLRHLRRSIQGVQEMVFRSDIDHPI